MSISNEVLNQIIEAVVGILALVITGVILPKVRGLIIAKTNKVETENAVNEIFMQVDTAVDYVEQTMVNQLKKDGKWNSETQKEALNKAIDVVLANLSQTTLNYLQKNCKDIVKTIANYIESNILKK